METRFTRSARTRFLEMLEEIRRDRPLAATKVRDRAEAALVRLQHYPDSGRSIPEFPELTHREVVLPPFRFFYRVVGTTVWIVAVWHTRQLPRKP